MAPTKGRPSRKTASAAIVAVNQATCEKAGGVWLGGQCVLEGTISLRIFKGNPCQGDMITRIVRASDPAFRNLAKVGLTNDE